MYLHMYLGIYVKGGLGVSRAFLFYHPLRILIGDAFVKPKPKFLNLRMIKNHQHQHCQRYQEHLYAQPSKPELGTSFTVSSFLAQTLSLPPVGFEKACQVVSRADHTIGIYLGTKAMYWPWPWAVLTGVIYTSLTTYLYMKFVFPSLCSPSKQEFGLVRCTPEGGFCPPGFKSCDYGFVKSLIRHNVLKSSHLFL